MLAYCQHLLNIMDHNYLSCGPIWQLAILLDILLVTLKETLTGHFCMLRQDKDVLELGLQLSIIFAIEYSVDFFIH